MAAILKYLQPLTKFELRDFDDFRSLLRKFPTPKEHKEILISRFKQRGRSDRSTSDVTLYEHLRSLGLLKAVLSGPVIEKIQFSLEVFEIEEQLRLLESRRQSFRNFPAEFHRAVLRAIYDNILKLHSLADRYAVKSDWFNEYISASHKQMIEEARALFPLYNSGERRLSTETSTKSEDALIPSVYFDLQDALESAGLDRGRKELSIQLTSAFCQRSSFFSASFSPEAVRQKIQRLK